MILPLCFKLLKSALIKPQIMQRFIFELIPEKFDLKRIWV